MSKPYTPPALHPPPIGFMVPQCLKVLANNGNNIGTDVPQQSTVTRSQSYPFGQFGGVQQNLGFPQIPANNNSVVPTYGLYPPISTLQNNATTTTVKHVNHFHQPQQQIPPSQQQLPFSSMSSNNVGFNFISTFRPPPTLPHQNNHQQKYQSPPPPPVSYFKNNDNVSRRNSCSSSSSSFSPAVPVELPSYKKGGQRNGNLYKNLEDEIRDLIDLGQDDGRNVLEAFDPLFDKPSLQQQQQQQYHEEQPQIVPELSPPLPPSSTTQQQQPPTANKGTTSIRDDMTTRSSNVLAETTSTTTPETDQSGGPSSLMSTKSMYGWKSDISLYPSLSTPTSYDTLQSSRVGSDAGDAASILYDAYNQFEYLYQVSISSESSSFYWHPNDASPYSSGAPPSPSRPSDYVSSQSVRAAKAGRRSSDSVINISLIYAQIFNVTQELKLE